MTLVKTLLSILISSILYLLLYHKTKSHDTTENMPVFPGTEPPKIMDAYTIEKNGFAEKLLTFYSHTGTHMDAPAHMIDGCTLDQLPINHYVGTVFIIDAESYDIGIDYFIPHEKDLKKCDFVLLRTNWDKHWGQETYFSHFPAITKEAAIYLSSFSIKGFGVDTISVDHMENSNFDVHQILLKSNFVLIENLTNLDQICTGDFLAVLPLKIKSSDGSPIRAIAIKDKL